MTVTISGGAITAAAQALVAYAPDQARDPAGTSTGGQFSGDGSDQSESQNDEVAKDLYRKLLALPPEQRDAFLKGLNPDQLTRLGKFASTGKASDGPIADIRNKVGSELQARGMNPAAAGLKAKGGAKKKAAKKGGSKGGGGSKGKSGGSGKKSSGGSKSSGSSKKSSSSGKSSSSSSSKKSADPAKSTKTEKPAKTPPPPQVTPQPIGGPGRSRGPGGPPRVTPVRASAVPRVVIAAAPPAKPRPRISVKREETSS